MAANRKLLAAAFAAISFLTAGPARAAVGRPVQTAPADGAVVQFLPAMAWTAVPGADKYQFQRGKLVFSASKSRYQPAYGPLKVR